MFAANKSFVRILSFVVCLVFSAGCKPAKTSISAVDIANRPEASLEEINQALNTWSFYKGSYPSKLAELEAAPFFKKRLPVPPPGQKLVVDRNGTAAFVRQ